MSSPRDDDYYPLRWKFADAVENIIILYQTKAAIAVAVFGVVFVSLGLMLLGWRPFGSDIEEAVAQDPADAIALDGSETGGVSVSRPIASTEQIESTKSGAVAELGLDTIRFTGGAASDAAADEYITLVTGLFPGRQIVDNQLLSSSFSESTEITIRIVDAGMFQGEGSVINSEFTTLIADISQAVQFNTAGNSVLVVGHAPTGPLSTERAESVANELLNQGLPVEKVSFTSLGNSEPLPETDSYIEFLLR